MPTESESLSAAPSLPTGSEADYVTVIIIGRPAYEFQQLNLQTGAAVSVQGRLRSWDTPREDTPMEDRLEANGQPGEKHLPRRDYRVEVIAEKVDPLQ
jgi:single-stranded DNA-binding protein